MAELIRLRIPTRISEDVVKESEKSENVVNRTGYVAGGDLDFNKRQRPRVNNVIREKSVWVAYLLWLVGGMFGLHLLYLRRERQAFVWMCTVGGYLGMGAMRDFVRIPEYVKEVNQEPSFELALKERMIKKKKPGFCLVRFVGQVLVSNSWSFLIASAVPEEEVLGVSLRPLVYLAPIGTALAVWNIGNIGREQGDIKWALIGAFLPLPLTYVYPGIENFSALASTMLFTWRSKQWRATPPQKTHVCKRLGILLLCGLLFSSLWFSFFYWNARVTDKQGEKIKLRDAAKNFLNSPMFLEFKKNLRAVWDDAWQNGWGSAWTSFVDLLDPLGEKHSLKVLGLVKGASQEDITTSYRKLAKEWHPDKHKDEDKEEANAKFIEIKEAYERLSSIKRQRKLKNKLSDEL